MFIIHLESKFHTPDSNVSLVLPQNDKQIEISHCSHIIVLTFTKRRMNSTEASYFLDDLFSYKISTHRIN